MNIMMITSKTKSIGRMMTIATTATIISNNNEKENNTRSNTNRSTSIIKYSI